MQYVAVFFITPYNSSLSSFVPNFRIIRQVVAEKSLAEKMSICITLERQKETMKNWKKKAKYRLASFFSFTQYTLPT